MHFLAMSIVNRKSKQVFSNYFVVLFKYICYKVKDKAGGGKKEGGRQKGILTKFPNCKVSPIRRL